MQWIGTRREWIVDLDSLAEERAEISRQLCRGGYTDNALSRLALAKAFIGEKEKRLMSAVIKMWKEDRTTGGYTKLILTKRVAGRQEKVSSIHLLVSQKLPCGTVEGVCSGFCGNVDDSAGDTSEFREVIVRLKLELLDVVADRRVVVVSEKREVVDSIQQEHVASVSLSIHGRKNEGTHCKTSPATASC